MPLNWQTNYWAREGDDSEENWKVYLKTDVRNILVSIFDDYRKAVSFMINNEAEIYRNYHHMGNLYMLDSSGNYHYEYLGKTLLADLPLRLTKSVRNIFTIYCPETTVTFLVDKSGYVEHSFQGKKE